MTQVRFDDVCPAFDNILHGAALIIGLGFAFFDMDRALRAGADTRAQAVAEQIADQTRLSVNDLQRAFRTPGYALAATSAL